MKKADFFDFFRKHNCIVGDCAMGTNLGEIPPEKFNLHGIDKVFKIHKASAEAGAQIITTNSFGGSYANLQQYGFTEEQASVSCYKAAQIACATKAKSQNEILVAGSIGPIGQIEVEETQLISQFINQAEALVKGGVDFILLETFFCLTELSIAIAAVESATKCQMPIAATMSFCKNGCTTWGVTPEKALLNLYGLGIRVIGANCQDYYQTVHAMHLMRAYASQLKTSDIFLAAQPDAGNAVFDNEVGKTIWRGTPKNSAECAKDLRDIGVKWVGGCCGTTPEHIRAIAQALK